MSIAQDYPGGCAGDMTPSTISDDDRDASGRTGSLAVSKVDPAGKASQTNESDGSETRPHAPGLSAGS